MYCLHRAQISCMSFSPEDTYLAMSSCTDTVHIFRLSEPQEEKYEVVVVAYGEECVQRYYRERERFLCRLDRV